LPLLIRLLKIIRRIFKNSSSYFKPTINARQDDDTFIEPTEADNDEVCAYYMELAKQGDMDALFMMGQVYELGKFGYEQSNERALECYIQAAKTGDPIAVCNLAKFYIECGPPQQSDEQAVVWLRKAADNHHADAQYMLAQMYEAGRGGLEQSNEQATAWLRKAAAQHHAAANKRIAHDTDKIDNQVDADDTDKIDSQDDADDTDKIDSEDDTDDTDDDNDDDHDDDDHPDDDDNSQVHDTLDHNGDKGDSHDDNDQDQDYNTTAHHRSRERQTHATYKRRTDDEDDRAASKRRTTDKDMRTAGAVVAPSRLAEGYRLADRADRRTCMVDAVYHGAAELGVMLSLARMRTLAIPTLGNVLEASWKSTRDALVRVGPPSLDLVEVTRRFNGAGPPMLLLLRAHPGVYIVRMQVNVDGVDSVHCVMLSTIPTVHCPHGKLIDSRHKPVYIEAADKVTKKTAKLAFHRLFEQHHVFRSAVTRAIDVRDVHQLQHA